MFYDGNLFCVTYIYDLFTFALYVRVNEEINE